MEEENYAEEQGNKLLEAKAQAIIINGVVDTHLEYLKERTAYSMFINLEENFKSRGVRSRIWYT